MRRRVVVAAMAVALAAALSACTSQTPNPGPTGPAPKFTIIGDSTSVLSWNAVKTGATKAGQDLGVTVVFTAANGSASQQATLIKQAITGGTAGVGVGVRDGQAGALQASLTSLGTAKIPYVVFDAPGAGGAALASVVSNDAWIGQTAAQHMAALLGNKGKVAIIGGTGSGSGKARADAFKSYLKAHAPGVTVVSTVNGATQASAKAAATTALGTSGLAGIFATDGNAALGASAAVTAQKAKVKVIGVDALPAEVNAVKSKAIAGAIAQNPFNVGYQMVRLLAQANKGTPSPNKTVYSNAVWYTAATIKDPAVVSVLSTQQ